MILLLPNQLFPEIDEEATLVEHPKFFKSQNFHKQKLVLHKASMTAYSEQNNTDYIGLEGDYEVLFEKNDKLKVFDPVDHEIKSEFEELADKHDCELVIMETPMFMASRRFNREYFEENKYFQLEYYKEMRRKNDILMEDGGPEGGRWSFDPDNRKKMPQDMETPEIPQFESDHVEEAKEWVEENFPNNPGQIDNFFWPTTTEEALEMLDDFLENRLENFGDYQDAFEKDLEFGFHSLLSSSLNIGLITPENVVKRTLEMHEEREYPMNCIEGFLRQIVGWREFIRATYQLEPDMKKHDFWKADNSMPEEFYTGETGLPPVDYAIEHVRTNAYAHHIERLMVLGNVMLLLEIDPDEVYDWFIEMFIDSYEWVMVPNIYGMSQYAYPEMMTKPYISSSNYIGKMSHYEGGEWQDHWDGLYWSFINKHKNKVSEIQRMSFMVSTLDRMGDDTLENHLENAESFRTTIGLD